MSINLFAPYNPDEGMRRILPRVKGFAEDLFVIQVPNHGVLCDYMAGQISEYIEEVSRCNGQESRAAKEMVYSIHDQMIILSVAGLISEDWCVPFQRFMRSVLFDELRRCGIGKYSGALESKEEYA